MQKSVTANKNHNRQKYWLTFQTCITNEHGLEFFYWYSLQKLESTDISSILPESYK